MECSFAESYLRAEDKALRLWPKSFHHADLRCARVKEAASRGFADPVRLELLRQNSKFRQSRARERNLQLLTQSNCALVLTGQQVGLFLGPLFTLYKVASAIKAAKVLEAESGTAVLPVFWLQNEDHDLEEINECWVQEESGLPQVLRLDSTAENKQRLSLKYQKLPPTVEQALEQAKALLQLSSSDPYYLLLRDAYRPGRSFSDAFAEVLAEVFAEEGLLIFDPRTDAAIKAAQPVYAKALNAWQEISQTLQAQEQRLKEAAFSMQVHLRADSPLFFFHQGDGTGPRHRLRFVSGMWQTIEEGEGRSLSEEELGRFLSEQPERFSSSALLRPLVQDSLFPTAAYVAGPAEINYFSQLEPLYEVFALSPPLLIRRASFFLLDAKTRRLIEKLGIEKSEILKSAEAFAGEIKRVLPDSSVLESLHTDAEANLKLILSRYHAVIEQVDQTLLSSWSKTKGKIETQLNALHQRLSEAVYRQAEVTDERISFLRNTLWPEGKPQERVLGGLQYLVRYGRELVTKLQEAIDPFAPETKEIAL